MTSAIRNHDLALRIREMTESDIDVIAQLEADIFPDPWPRRSFADILEQPDWKGLVVECEGQSIAYACILLSAGEMHLANIAVTAAFRRKSVASRLLGRILEIATEQNCSMILLEVRVSNQGARAFYEREGFTGLYTRPRYYRRPLEDALVMVRYLR